MSLEVKVNYKYLISHELKIRVQKNPSYSLRAFAKFLEVSPAYISQIFSQKRILSDERAKDFSKKFKWPAKKRKLFLALIQYEKTKDPQVKQDFLEQIEDLLELEFIELQEDQFQLISEGYHYSIIELTNIKDFRADPKWVAERLGITLFQAESGMQRLLRLGLLKHESGSLRKSMPNYRIDGIPSIAIRAFHKEKLRLAEEALETQSLLERDFAGVTLSIRRKDVAHVRELSRNFIEKLMKLSDKVESPDSVYHLSTQFFRLDKEFKKK